MTETTRTRCFASGSICIAAGMDDDLSRPNRIDRRVGALQATAVRR